MIEYEILDAFFPAQRVDKINTIEQLTMNF